ncbi:release factor glutamine methyltransferase [Erythrobacter sp. Dej080120_24]|jgi:release factor glutamine methyltransferase|uniref:peptide chain release factor N(5)-glutamine methyltransferase n=1 Tax=Erythrobacter sp. Dej080120_24 TaxID=3024837 RepID=UPI0004D3D270|nr:SAM-dependent methyltransferase [Erythrobacter sp. JL475]BDW80697.1 release factor glutamine methyltransferase [Erythrobacter sp. Dej080120_24]
MTVGEKLREATERLAASSDTPRLDAELLMAHAVGTTRSELLLRGMNEVLASNLDHFDELVARRVAHEPVAYILGSAEFYGRSYAVSPDVLIPRPDSEALIEAALERVPKAERLLDLGTGSGCLLLTAMLELNAQSGIGIDASEGALSIARRNAAKLGVAPERVQFSLRNWHQPGWSDDLGTFELILCNPPYVEAEAQLDPDVRDFEPASALFAGPEGLDDYRAIIPQMRELLNPEGIAILEIGHTQADAVGRLAQAAGFNSEIRHDLAKRPRAVVLW